MITEIEVKLLEKSEELLFFKGSMHENWVTNSQDSH